MTLTSLLLPLLPLAAAWSSLPHSALAVDVPAVEVRADYRVTTSVPRLYIEGQPFVVTLTVAGTGTKPVEAPAWLLTAAAWDIDSKELARREADGAILLAPGQEVSTSLNLAELIEERLADDPRDFRVRCSGGTDDPVEVIHLAIPESGLDFDALPKEQLANYQVALQTAGGWIWLNLWPEVAPNHVRNFLDLCSTGFYDGSPFHRVIPGFMVQSGRSAGGTAAPRKLNQEFSTRRHGAGVLSAARLDGDENSATSEFFITHRPNPKLDGKYTAFGEVIVGMEAIDKIVKGVEVHYALVNALARNGHRINPNDDPVARAMNVPNPKQEILQALVIKTTKSRPIEKR